MKRLAGIAFVVAVASSFSGSALAAPAQLTIDTRETKLSKADDEWTTSLGFTNLTDRAIPLAFRPADASDAGCALKPRTKLLDEAAHSTIDLTIPAGCEVSDEDGIDLTVTAGTGATPRTFAVTAAPKPASGPDWVPLRAFAAALGIALLATVFGLFFYRRRWAALEHLDASWSIEDSWLSTVTVGGGLLTGLFGASGVVSSLAADGSGDNAVALATVGAAIAVALVAAAALIVATAQTRDGKFTVHGLLFASAFVLAAAFGELWVMHKAGGQLDLGGLENQLDVFMYLAMGLLVLYTAQALPRTIRAGLTPPPEPPPTESDTIKAARMVVEALDEDDTVQIDRLTLDAAVGTILTEAPQGPAAASPARTRRRTSVML